MNTNDAVAVLRTRVQEMIGAAYTYGEYSKEAVEIALEGVLDEIDALAATDSAATVAKEGDELLFGDDTAERDFTEYMRRNYPTGTEITEPDWHAARIFMAAKQALKSWLTPKPEASAATQQVRLPDGFVWPSPPSRKEQSPVLFDDGYDEGWAKCIDTLKSNLAAPISEDTAQCCGAFSAVDCPTNCTLSGSVPAAQVSDGDAMPPLPKQRETQFAYQMHEYGQACIAADRSLRSDSRFYMDHGLWHDRVTGQHMYTQDQYDEESRTCLKEGKENAIAELTDPARTVTGSGGSIGDDDEFVRLLKMRDQMASDGNTSGGLKVLAAIIGYIDARAARNAGVGAPDTSARDAALEEAANVAKVITGIPGDLLGRPTEAMERLATAGARISAAIRALKSKGPAA